MTHFESSDLILLDRAMFYRGLLIVPLRLPGDEYSFAVVDPESWDAADSDGNCYGSIDACLRGGQKRVERYFERLPTCVHQLFECFDQNQSAPSSPAKSPSMAHRYAQVH